MLKTLSSLLNYLTIEQKLVIRYLESFKTVQQPLLQVTLNFCDGSYERFLFSKPEQRSLKESKLLHFDPVVSIILA